MTEFWESIFHNKQAMWGFEPADSAIATADLFREKGLKNVLIPGFGYGRNAKPFKDNGCNVTGIEISETAIKLAEKQYGDSVKVYHGSVSDMPFDQKLYDGIFCYALIHLLPPKDRIKLISDCYNQLSANGYMVFTAVSKMDAMYQEGRETSKDTFETRQGIRLFFYDADSVETEFGNFGLAEAKEIEEPAKNTGTKPSLRFWQITCRKNEERF